MSNFVVPIDITHQDTFLKSKFFVPFSGTKDLTGCKIGLKSITIYNSWNNIDPSYNNQLFSMIFPSGVGNTTINFTIPAGIYTVDDLNNFLKNYFIINNLYITNNTTGAITVYAQFVANGTAYSIDFVSFPLPTSTPAGYTSAGGITWPTTQRGPQIVILDNGFKTITGYNPGTYPTVQQSTIYTKQRDNIPVISPVSCVRLCCDAVLNRYVSDSSIIHSFTSKTAGSGQLIDTSPNQVSFIECSPGSRAGLTVYFTDQLGRPLMIQDPDITINVLIQEPINIVN